MPKVLVLFYSRSGSTARLADAVVEGARSVEYTEVDVRRLERLAPSDAATDAERTAYDELTRRYRPFEGVESLAQYDGIVIGVPSNPSAGAGHADHLLEALGSPTSGALRDTVGAAFASGAPPHGSHEATCWAIMATMAKLEMILVPPSDGAASESELESASALGRRVAEVSEWVRHARSHQHGHSHGHSHAHVAHTHEHTHGDHPPDHGHRHTHGA